jgi:protocatechuate 3,4-dioxygenase beta subunit
LALFASLCFVLGLSDSRAAVPIHTRTPAVKMLTNADRPGKLRATVRGSAGVLERSTVQVYWERDRVEHWVGLGVTDDTGSTTIEHLPHGALWILAEAPGYGRASTRIVLEDSSGEVSLSLPLAHALHVRVRDELGAAIEAATALVTGSDPLPFGALTDHAGVAHFARLGEAPWSLKVSAPGFESVARSSLRADTEVTLRRLGAIDVLVLDPSGKPAAQAEVAIGGASLWPARTTRADAGGLARIAGLLPGSYDLRAALGGAVSKTTMGFELGRGAHEHVTLTLEPGRSVTALVTDGAGPSPIVVPNADVVLAEGGVGTFPIRGRTGTDGKVTLGPIAGGPATLGARAPDFVGSSLVAVPEILEGPVRIALIRGGTLRGDVVDARGFPVDGASIEVVGSDDDGLPIAETPALVAFRQSHFAWALAGPVPLISAGELGVMPGPVPPIPRPGELTASSAAPDFAEPANVTPWVSAANGEFVAKPVSPGRVRAIVRHPDYVEGASDVVPLAPGAEAHVKIVLLQGGSLEGRVKDERDDPVAGAEIELSSSRATRTQVTTTASDGTFAFAAVPPDITLSVARPEDVAHVVLTKTLHVAEGAREKIELVLPATREGSRIVVRDESDQPIEMAEVTVLSLEPDRPLRATRFTNSDGAAQIPDAAGASVRVLVAAPGFARHVESQASLPSELKVTLARGVSVTGRVTAVRGRVPVEHATVTLETDGQRKSTSTDSDGGYRFADVPPGEVRLTVSHPDYADEKANVTVDATGRADRPFEAPTLDLSDAGEIEGDVTDDRGSKIAGARVAIDRVPSYLPAGALPTGVVVTDSDGHFVLRKVHPGTLAVAAAASSIGHGAVRDVIVNAGRTTRDITIQLRRERSEDEPLAAAGLAVTLGERGSGADLEVVIVAVAATSEAERAGLQSGDVLLAVDGVRPASMGAAREAFAGPAGSDVVVELGRAGESLKLRVTREALRR